MSKIKTCFIESLRQTLTNLSTEHAADVRARLLSIVGEYTAPYMFSADLIAEVTTTVFQDETFRDWLLNTRFVFFMNLASIFGQQMVTFIIDNLARSASLDLGAEEDLDVEQQAMCELVVETPQQVVQELLNYRAAKVALVANSWLVVIMLALAFVHLEHEVLQTPGLAPAAPKRGLIPREPAAT